MPRRRRLSKALYGPLSIDELNMWATADRDELVAVFGSLVAARGEWGRRKAQFPSRWDDPPEAFWVLFAPVRLREVPDATDPRVDPALAAEEQDRLLPARERWLMAQGGIWLAVGDPRGAAA